MKRLARYIIESDGMTKAAAPGDVASRVAAFLRKSPVIMPALGGIAGAGMMTPYALKSFKEGRTLEGVGQLGTGAVLGAGTGLLGRAAMRSAATVKEQAEIIKELQQVEKKRPGILKRMFSNNSVINRIDKALHEAKAPPKEMTRLQRLMQPKNTYTAGGAILGAGLAAPAAEKNFEEGEEAKGVSNLALGVLLGGVGGKLVSSSGPQKFYEGKHMVQESRPYRFFDALFGKG